MEAVTNETPLGRMTRLLMQHRTELYGFIYACVRNHHDTEDLLQAVSVAVTEAAQQGFEPAAFDAWAREIAWRRVLAHHRLAGRQHTADPELVRALAEASGRVELARPSPVLREALLECLERVPEETRRVLQARYQEAEKELRALAARLGRSVQGVYAMLKRARAALRDCVERRLASEVRG